MSRRVDNTVDLSKSVYVFHHAPKCGGTSLIKALDNWFITVRDYRQGWTMNYQGKIDLNMLQHNHCLCGHFELDGYYLFQRYPEILSSDRYKMFTFVRDPLQVQLSLYSYEKLHKILKVSDLAEYLSLRSNFIAKRFPATLDNYKQVIDRYFFIGILEESQTSLDILASIIGKHPVIFPWINRSGRSSESGNMTEEITQEMKTAFKNNNVLDYLIYDYCIEKFNKALAEHGE